MIQNIYEKLKIVTCCIPIFWVQIVHQDLGKIEFIPVPLRTFKFMYTTPGGTNLNT